MGTNRDEGTLFHSSFFALEVASEMEYRAALGRRFGQGNVAAIAMRYPVAMFSDANRALAEVTGDAFFVCPARRAARGAAAAGVPVYLYSFEREPSEAFLAGLGVFHSAEIPFVFGTDPAFPLARVGEGGQATAAVIQELWTRFAATGDPNGAAPVWPAFGADDRHLVIGGAAATLAESSGLKRAACDFWDGLVLP
jgi:para-nitrobenzyl esterase